MSKLVWDDDSHRLYETGVKKGVLYVWDETQNSYGKGVAWNGLTGVTQSPSGAEATNLYADDIKYLSLTSAEEFGCTIEAYQSPEEFDQCDGLASPVAGLKLSGQKRKKFAFSYVTTIGNDELGNDYGYKIHIVYGCRAGVSERAYSTINDSPEAMTLSWEVTTTPIVMDDYKPISHLEINSTTADAAALAAIENSLYGTAGSDPTLLLPEAIIASMGGSATYTYNAIATPASGANPKLSGWYERTGESPDYIYFKTDDTTVANGKTYYTLTVTNPA